MNTALKFIVAAAISAISLEASAAEPRVMWRTGDSGVLPSQVQAPTAPVTPGQGGGGVEDKLIMEVPSMFYFYTSGSVNRPIGIYVIGGKEPYTFSYSGQLPSGLRFVPNSNGPGGSQAVVQGRPTSVNQAGNSITLSVTDAAGLTASRTILIGALTDPLTLQGPIAPEMKIGASHKYGYPAVNAIGKVTYRLGGVLPAGIALNASSGELMGSPVPGTKGTYMITLTAQDSVGQSYRIVIDLKVTD